MHVYLPHGGDMKKRRIASLRQAATTALLEHEHPTVTKVSTALVLAEARRKFGVLRYEGLQTATERWQLTEVLEQIYRDYRTSIATDDQRTADDVRKFMVKYDLRS